MRTMPFGKRAEGMAVYVILDEQRRVVVVSVMWLELSGCLSGARESADAEQAWLRLLHHSRAAVVGPYLIACPRHSPQPAGKRYHPSRFSLVIGS